MAKDYDPLSYLPSAEAVRRRLESASEEVRKLRILLRVAEQIENRRGLNAIDARDGQEVTNA